MNLKKKKTEFPHNERIRLIPATKHEYLPSVRNKKIENENQINRKIKATENSGG